MKKLYVNIYDNEENESRWLEIVPFDEREEEHEINMVKTCFIQKVMFHGVNCLKIKEDCGGLPTYRHYYPIGRYSIRHVETFE